MKLISCCWECKTTLLLQIFLLVVVVVFVGGGGGGGGGLILFLLVWFSSGMFTFATKCLVHIVDGFPSLFLYIYIYTGVSWKPKC